MIRRAAMLLLVAGCAHEARAPAPPQPSAAIDDVESKMSEVSRAIGRLDRALLAAGRECSEVAAAYRRFAASSSAVVADVAAELARLSGNERDQFRKRHVGDADRLQELYARATGRCPKDAEVAAAIELAHARPTPAGDSD